MLRFYMILLLDLAYISLYMRKGLAMENNLATISWCHSVNDKTYLETSLHSDIDMLEADVVIGRLSDGNETNIPIMAHPPNDVSNLSLNEFVDIVDDFNNRSAVKKGIKLDFKCIQALELAIMNKTFTAILSKANYPVWLNADILEGPLAPPTVKPVNAIRFLQGAKLFPKSILSLGWTTGFNETMKAGYTESNIQEMLQTLESNEVHQQATFAVRAGLVAESQGQMVSLLRNNTHTLTIWSGLNDTGFDVDKLNSVLDVIGVRRIYVDVPHQLRSQLKLVNSTNAFES